MNGGKTDKDDLCEGLDCKYFRFFMDVQNLFLEELFGFERERKIRDLISKLRDEI